MHRIRLLIISTCLAVLAGLWPGGAARASAGVPADPLELDKYGGYRNHQVAGGATGFFRIQKDGNRWLFATPDGNAFWLRSVYVVHWMDGGEIYHQVVARKYADGKFYTRAVQRLRGWGFNALGEYSDLYALPIGTYNRPAGNPEKMPFLIALNASFYGIKGGVFKNIYHGIDTAIHPRVYVGIFPDVFDPAFPSFVEKFARDDERVYNGASALNASPWLLGVTTDDGDYTTGFGPGPEAAVSQGKTHPHLGWVVAVAAPSLPRATLYGAPITYRDPKVYAKYAFRDFLRAKYDSMQALNAAWGASYTTWESDGGWPNGRGVLDESGRSRWISGDFDVTRQSPQVKADLDEFLSIIADRYFGIYAAKIRQYLPNHLVFSPATMQAGTRSPILKAAGRYLDAIQTGGVPLGPSYPFFRRIYDEARKPVFVWTTFTAQADAGLNGPDLKGWGPAYNKANQELRGRAYAEELANLVSLSASSGEHFVLGINWWEWSDKTIGGENMNFGLVTVRDNAYDGKESIVDSRTDSAGYAVGGENKKYGNFLGFVADANRRISAALEAQVSKRGKTP